MKAKTWYAAAVATVMGAGFYAAPASAQATRTWVSGVGDDANPCSRNAPCKTFAGSISKTAAGGEINCLDSGGFGVVTITKSISIVCDSVDASILASGTSGITVNGAGVVVTLSGLSITGYNATTNDGIAFINGASLLLDNVKIRGFGNFGIRFEPGTAATLTVKNTLLSANGTAGTTTTGAMVVRPSAAVAVSATISGSQIVNNQSVGARIETTQAGSTINVTFVDNVVSNSTNGLLFRAPASTGTINGTVDGVTIANNTSYGLIASGPGTALRVGNTTINANATGVAALGTASLTSFGDNRLLGNAANGVFPLATPKQ